MPICLNCGNSFKTRWNDTRKNVKSCSQCTLFFSEDTAEKIIKDFLKW